MNATKKLILPKNLTLYPFQRDLVGKQVASRARYLYNSCEMGLGKSIQALVYANSTASKNVLIICPAVVRLNWARESNKWFTLRPGTVAKPILSGKCISGILKNKLLKKGKTPSPLIISYTMLVVNQKVRDYVLSRDWDLVILDEFHECKSVTAKRTQAVCKDVWPKAKRVYMLSGTPLTNSALDLFPFLYKVSQEDNSLTPEQRSLCSDYEAFANHFCYKWVYKGYEPRYTGIKNNEELKDILLKTNVFFRLKKKDVLKDLPAKTYHRVDLELTIDDESDSKVINTFLKAFERDKESDKVPNSIMSLRRQLGEAKSTCTQVYDYIQNLLDVHDEPVIIASHHKSVVKKLKQRLRDYNPVVVDGSTSAANKQQAVDDFQSGKTNVFIGNIKAAGVGITLTRSCNVIFLEYEFLPYLNEQFVDRAHRIGQEGNVIAHYMVANHQFDQQLVTNMIRKQKAISGVIA